MPRDNDKDNASRGRRDRPPGGKGRSGAARGPDKKFAKRGFGKSEGGKRTYGSRDDRPRQPMHSHSSPQRSVNPGGRPQHGGNGGWRRSSGRPQGQRQNFGLVCFLLLKRV